MRFLSTIAIIIVLAGISFNTIIAQEEKQLIEYGEFTDPRDGNVYRTVKIGNQVWMADNLRYKTKYESWAYNHVEDNVKRYGRLYTYTSALQACPEGWYLPSDSAWNVLVTYLGGPEQAGIKMRNNEAKTWFYSNFDGDNSSGFTATPGGYRGSYGNFLDIGILAFYWSSTDENEFYAWSRALYSNYNGIYRNLSNKRFASNVRCLKEITGED